MLEITICTADNGLRKHFEIVVTQLMNTNHIDFHLTEVKTHHEIKENTFLILGDSDSLYQYHTKKMMIVVLNNHQHDDALSKLALTCLIEKDQVETHLYETVSHWLDYYFENYHYNLDDIHDFFVNEVVYFKVNSFNDLTAVFMDRQVNFSAPKGYEVLLASLPTNFLAISTEYIINLEMISKVENSQATMLDGSVIDHVEEDKVQVRATRFELDDDVTFAIGDKYTQAKIKKSNQQALIASLILTLFVIAVFLKATDSILLGTAIGIPVFFMVKYLMYMNIIGAAGNYYELRDDGVHYYDSVKMKDRYRWSKAIEKGDEEKMLSFVPYDDVVYIRIGTRTGGNMGVMFAGMKNYSLNLKIETTTTSLSFEESFDLVGFFKTSKRHDDIAHLLNKLRLMGKRIEGNEFILMAFNDPDASLKQYMNKRNNEN